MITEELTLSDSAWTEALSDGGNLLMQCISGAVLVAFSESGAPAVTADALLYEPSQFKSVTGFGDVPAGTGVYLRAYSGSAVVMVAK